MGILCRFHHSSGVVWLAHARDYWTTRIFGPGETTAQRGGGTAIYGSIRRNVLREHKTRKLHLSITNMGTR
jgi:hypothetical protein